MVDSGAIIKKENNYTAIPYSTRVCREIPVMKTGFYL
jgi:hypothetical protein